MRKSRLSSLFAVFLGVALTAVAPASADMKAFNAAVKAGDYRSAAVAAKTAWTSWDKSDPDTAVVAREFGFAAYMSGDYATAREYGLFLQDHGASLPKPDDQPVISRVLLSAANYRLGASGQTRQALFDALKIRAAGSGIDMQSIVASEALYRGDWASRNWMGAAQSGEMAYALIERAGSGMLPRAMQGKTVSVIAGFLGGRDKQDYENIVEAHNAVVDAIDKAPEPKRRQDLIPLKFQLEAWASSVHAFFESSQQTGSLIPKNVKELPLKETGRSLFEERQVGADACQGELDTTGLRYPHMAEFTGMVGTVILKFDTNAQGSVSNTEVLAAVPVAQFAKTVEAAASRFRLKPRSGDPVGCSLVAQSRVITFSFVIL